MISNNVGLTKINGLQGLEAPALKEQSKTDKADFLNVLQNELGKSAPPKAILNDGGIKFSNHAIERIQSRNMQVRSEDMARLNEAVGKLAQKGAREALVLMGDNAFVVSVKNKTVITAMDKAMMKENVFTNIDSTVVL